MEDIDKFISAQDSVATKYGNTYAFNTITRFCKSINENRAVASIPADELNIILCQFFMDIKKQDGKEYEPDSLTTLHRGLQRYFDSVPTNFNILVDPIFAKSRETLAAKRKLLTKLGFGNKPNATRELAEEEIDKLFSEGFFGMRDPQTLQRTMWWFISLHFGFRARNEARKLCWGDVVLEYDDTKKLHCLVLFKERGTKTRMGKENEEKRFFNPVVYENLENPERCPVSYYKEFALHRPIEALSEDSPFFLSVKHKINVDSERIWYLKTPLGKNKIGEFLSNAASAHNLTGKKVANHSVRKTSIGKLLDANVPEIFVAQHSGHKSVDSLKSYKSANKHHRFEMSRVLSGSLNNNVYNSNNNSQRNPFSCISGGTFSNCQITFAPLPPNTDNKTADEPCEKRPRI